MRGVSTHQPCRCVMVLQYCHVQRCPAIRIAVPEKLRRDAVRCVEALQNSLQDDEHTAIRYSVPLGALLQLSGTVQHRLRVAMKAAAVSSVRAGWGPTCAGPWACGFLAVSPSP